MGVYIPPPNDGNSSGGGDSTGSGNNNSNEGGSGNGGTTIKIPNPSHFIPRNPSMGLKLWGPLVPASDNLGGLYFLTALQLGMGMIGLHRARQLRKSRLLQFNVPNNFQTRLTKYSCMIGGAYLIFQSGLEMTRLLLPYDPWCEEARYYRRLAAKNGDGPSWWFGAFSYYTPMTFKEWNSKVENWISNTANRLEFDESIPNNSINAATKLAQSASLLSSLAKKGRYSEIHQSLHETNQKRFDELLANELANVTELNKALRVDAIMEGSGRVKYNEGYEKPYIQFGNHRMESDDEFEAAWLNLDPWEEMRLDTMRDMRLIPGWVGNTDPEETQDVETVQS